MDEEVIEFSEKIMQLIPDYVTPYQLYRVAKKNIGNNVIPLLKTLQKTPWGLTWDDLLKIAERIPGKEGRGFFIVVAKKRGTTTAQCELCWRKFRKTSSKQSACQLHSSKNIKEYFRLKRLLPKFEERFQQLKVRKINIGSVQERLSQYPNVTRYLQKQGIEVDLLKGNDGALAVIAALYSPLDEIPSYLLKLPQTTLTFDTILPKAEVWLSLLDARTGKAKNWGGKRNGAGKKTCHTDVISKIEHIQ